MPDAACGNSSPHGPHTYQDGWIEDEGMYGKRRTPHMKACPGIGADRLNPLKRQR